jgi:hypothetical protein
MADRGRNKNKVSFPQADKEQKDIEDQTNLQLSPQ